MQVVMNHRPAPILYVFLIASSLFHESGSKRWVPGLDFWPVDAKQLVALSTLCARNTCWFNLYGPWSIAE